MSSANNLLNGANQGQKNGMTDIPIGFGMSLSRDWDALNYFGTLTDGQKSAVIRYVQGSNTGEGALERVNTAVRMLGEHTVSFTDF